MTDQNLTEENIPNFWRAIIIHNFFGIIEFTLILITIVIYISNIVFLIVGIAIIGTLFMVLAYVLFSKNPYYYFACIGLICITVVPCLIALIFYIGTTTWSYEPIKIFIVSALVIESVYIYVLIREISQNKYLGYFHNYYMMGYPMRVRSSLRATFFSVKSFEKLSKGRQYWQDRDPEEIKKIEEELKNFKKKHKQNILITVQILGFLAFNAVFYLSFAF
jgi:hypothetical protein